MRVRERMRRWWLLCLAVAVLSNGAVAQRVSRETARSVAETFFNGNVREGQAVHFTDITAETTFQNFYIFSADSGFVIVAADERVLPILGYSKKNPFVVEDMPVNLRWWLEGYDEQIQYAIDNQLPPSDENAEKWFDLTHGINRGGNRNIVEPLLSTSWGQGDPFNLLCPFDEDVNLRCVTGCVATAMAQIMKRWEHPSHGEGTVVSRKLGKKHPKYYPLEVDFGAATYEWNNMIDYYDIINGGTPEQNLAVATLMYHCGMSVITDYDFYQNGSSAFVLQVPAALSNNFYYKSSASFKIRADYGDDEWIQMLKQELNAMPPRPILYGGNDPQYGSHAFVCDGYDEDYGEDYFHFNWGWDGSCNSTNWSINNLVPSYNFNSSQNAVIGIEPDSATITTSVFPDNVGTVNGGGLCPKGNICTLIAEPDEGYSFANWTLNGDVVSDEPSLSFKVVENAHYVANFQSNYKEITTVVFPIVGGTASGGGTFLLGDTCTVTATPNLGFAFLGWFNGLMTFSYSDQPEYTFMVTEDKTLVARFVPRNYTVTTMCQPSTGGSVSGNQGSYPAGGTVTLTAHANSGYVFNGWMESGQVVCSSPTYTFQAMANRNLTASFTSSQFTISSLITNPDGSQGIVFHLNQDGAEGWMVALNDASEGCQWGEATDLLSLQEVPYNDLTALSDLSGYRNTNILRTLQGEESGYAAAQVDYANGWYLPSVGQLRKLYSALPFIDSALIAAGGSTLTEDTYWSSTEYSASDASTPMFSMGNTNKTSNCRVRAIRNFVKAGNNAVIVACNDNNRGTASVSGTGLFTFGDLVTVTATPNEGFVLDHWSEDGVVVSYDTEYQFTFTHSRSLVANFVVPGSLGNIVNNVDGSRGVVFWRSPDCSESLIVALEDVSAGCQWGEATDVPTLVNKPCNSPMAMQDVSGNTNTRCIRDYQGTENDYAASLVDFDDGWYLPAAGELCRLYSALPIIMTALVDAGGSLLLDGAYWSSTEHSGSGAVIVNSGNMGSANKTGTCRVRAIQHIAAAGPNAIAVKPNNLDYGTVTGTGEYVYSQNVIVTATANEGYTFESWTENGMIVSYDATYQFPFTRSRSLVANFVISGSIGNVVCNADGSKGVVFWVSPDGDEGLMVALEDASAGCQWGEATDALTLVNKPYNNVMALEDVSGNTNTRCIRNHQGIANNYAASLVDFENGWYLPSVGELRKLYGALPMIETALVNAGGSTLTEDTYWSSTEYSGSDAATATFSMGNTNKTDTCRVRAIRHFAVAGPNAITVKPNNLDFGFVTGSGDYAYGQSVTVTATANEGYTFETWTENGMIVSYDATYQFLFTRSRSLVANFVVSGSIGSVVCNADGSQGVVFWLSPDGDEGLMVALEDASVGCQWGEATDALTLLNIPYNQMALQDVSGNTNTRCIRKHQGINNDYAASLVDFEDGWYLPAAGELRRLYDTLQMIEASIVNAGGSLPLNNTYWSSTEKSGSIAYTINSGSMGSTNKTSTCRVRAIRHFATAGPNAITVKSNNLGYGTVTGSGEYSYGQDVTVTAIPNSGYTFNAWTENGMIVSYDATYQFPFTRSRSLVANFVIPNSIGSIVTNTDGSRGVVFFTYPSGIGGLVVALEDVSEGCPWGLNEDITIMENQSPSAVMNLMNDMCGKSNTNKIREWYSGNTNYAACKTDFANGWYLPSAGQLRKLYAALPMIESVVVNACGTMMTEDNYWSSTEQSASDAWTPMFAMNSTNKTSNCRVRAIRSLTNLETITTDVNIAAGGTVTGAGRYDYGQTCTLKATPSPTYAFLCWKRNGVTVSTDMEYSFTVLGSYTYVAHFVANSCNITTAMDPVVGGIVTGAGAYAIGTNCTLTATPHTGYTFTNWTKNGNEVSTQSTYSFTVTESGQYTAHFALNSYEIIATVFPEEGGAVSGAHAYTHGSTAILTALPTEGYTFINWKENGVVVSTSPTYQFVVTGNRTLQANFSNNAYTITAIAYPSDGGTIEGAGVYEYGTVATLTAHANNGYEFFCWFENDDIVSFEPTISFEVAEDVVIYAVFVEGENTITQTTVLSPGSNWFSTYLDITLDDLKEALEESGNTSIVIKSKTSSTIYNGVRWRGNLNTLDVTQMYKIQVNTPCEITLTGMPLNPADHPITIKNGPNWIGFPLNVDMSLIDAFAGFAVNGDVIKSKTGNATYTNRWRGTLNTLSPGQGYIYNSADENQRTFVFPTGAK